MLKKKSSFLRVFLSKYYYKNLKPYSLLIELTYRCNLNCPHCYIPKYSTIKQQELSFDEIKDIIDQAKKMGIFLLIFTGGEIFVRKDIFDILEYARKEEFLIRLKTNGTLITEDVAKKLAKMNIMGIDVSLYGSDYNSYKVITGNGKAFKKTLLAINNLEKAGIKVIVRYLILKENIFCAERIIDFVKKHNMGFSYDFRITPRIDGCKKPLKHACVDVEKLASAFNMFKTLKNVQTVDIEHAPMSKNKLCNVGCSGLVISPIGEVYPCLDWRMSLGNVRNEKLKDIWYNSDKIKKVRELNDYKTYGKCKNCKLSYFCRVCVLNILNCTSQVKKYANITKQIQQKLKSRNKYEKHRL